MKEKRAQIFNKCTVTDNGSIYRERESRGAACEKREKHAHERFIQSDIKHSLVMQTIDTHMYALNVLEHWNGMIYLALHFSEKRNVRALPLLCHPFCLVSYVRECVRAACAHELYLGPFFSILDTYIHFTFCVHVQHVLKSFHNLINRKRRQQPERVLFSLCFSIEILLMVLLLWVLAKNHCANSTRNIFIELYSCS